eukprot:8029199-Alexandrium_andersonii.AAC.1
MARRRHRDTAYTQWHTDTAQAHQTQRHTAQTRAEAHRGTQRHRDTACTVAHKGTTDKAYTIAHRDTAYTVAHRGTAYTEARRHRGTQ